MDIVNELFKYNNVFIKYMDQVNLYEEDFRMLDRYRAFIEFMKECNTEGLFNDPRTMMVVRRSMGVPDKIFIESGNHIIDGLKKHIMKEYIENKGK